jgi:hypothetical protein
MSTKYITHNGNEWLVHAEADGRVLGRHKTKEDALRQLRAIEASKARAAAAAAAAGKALKGK